MRFKTVGGSTNGDRARLNTLKSLPLYVWLDFKYLFRFYVMASSYRCLASHQSSVNDFPTHLQWSAHHVKVRHGGTPDVHLECLFSFLFGRGGSHICVRIGTMVLSKKDIDAPTAVCIYGFYLFIKTIQIQHPYRYSDFQHEKNALCTIS